MKIDAEKVTDHLVRFIKDTVTEAEKDGVVLGLSGGVDSAVVAMLAVKALEPEGVALIWLPSTMSKHENQNHARHIAKQCGVYLWEEPRFEIRVPLGADNGRVRAGNMAARERMAILYDWAMAHNQLVIGTSNKSEIMLGYGTLHGDMACDLNPIGGLYKTQVYQLAEYLGVPKPIIEKPPSADLWPGQTDEGELGFSYEECDPILQGIAAREIPTNDASDMTVKIFGAYCRNAFKRRGPLVAKIP